MNVPSSAGRLPFWRTVGRAYACLFRNPRPLLTVVWFPFVLTTCAYGALLKTWDWPGAGGAIVRTTLTACMLLVAPTIFAVAWHRFVVIGRESHAAGLRLRFGRREAKYLGLLCLAVLPFAAAIAWILITGAASSAESVAVVILLVVPFAVWPRLVLLLPAAALDQGLSVRWSWTRTRGVALRLGGMLLVPTLMFVALLSIPAWGRQATLALGWETLLVAYIVGYYFVWGAVVTTVLSLAFSLLWGEATPAPLAAAEVCAGTDDVLTWWVDRDFGWAHTAVAVPGAASFLWLAWVFCGWTGVVAAILPFVYGLRLVVYRVAVLLDDSALVVDRDTLKWRGRFGEMTLYLRDISDVSLRGEWGVASVCIVFSDLDRALAHTFFVRRSLGQVSTPRSKDCSSCSLRWTRSRLSFAC